MTRPQFDSHRQITTPQSRPQVGGNYTYFKDDGQFYVMDADGVETAVGAGGDGSSFIRTDSAPVTSSVGASAYVTTAVTLAESFRLFSMTVDKECRVRLYATAAGAAADASRPVTDDPPDGRGVILDYVTVTAGTFLLSPLVDGASMESSPSSSISMVVNNPDVSTQSITVSFTYLPTE